MAIEYKTVTYRTVESTNDNATYCWVELSAAHVPAVDGLIKRIVIQGATNGNTGFTLEPMYLGIWERQDDGGLIFLGCSKNAVTQSINQQNIWDFDGAIIRGKSLLLGLLSSPDGHWTNNTQLLLRSSVQTNDTDGCVILTDIGRIRVTPDITFTVDVPEYVPDADPEPEPEPESEQRVIDISKYWIPVIRKTANFQQIAAAENPEFNLLSEKLYDLEKDGFILTATESGVKQWEQILGLVTSDGMTLNERKAQILNYLNVKTAYTTRTLRQMLAAIVGDGNFNVKIDNETSTLHMSLTAGAMSKTNDIDQLLKRVLPENLVIKYNDMPMDYTLLEYLESSGTQYIDTGVVPQTDTRLYLDAEIVSVRSGMNSLFGVRNEVGTTRYYYDAYYNDEQSIGLRAYHRTTGASVAFPTGRFTAEYTGSEIRLNGKSVLTYKPQELTFDTANKLLLYAMNYNNNVSQQSVVKVYRFRLENDKETLIDFVPVLDEKGKPRMYDTVSHTCFRNAGSGKFGYRVKADGSVVMPLDLDDPYYTAPSGVWAKLIDENTLDIITALDPTVDESQGYKLFANVGDACKYFNIKEVIENE